MREKLLKTLAVFAFGMVSFPVVLTGDAHSFGSISAIRLLFYYAVYLAVFALGYFLGQITKRRKRLLIPCRLLGAGTFFLSLFLLRYTEQATVILAAGAGAVFWYFLGERASRKHYADFFPIFAFGIYIVVTVFSYFAFSFSAAEALRPAVQNAVVGSFLTELCLAALLINQSGIYDKASRRRETKTMLPRGLSGYNAALILLFTGAGLALYLFSGQLAQLLRETVRLILTLLLYLMRIFSTTMEAVPGETGDLSDMLPKNGPIELWNILAPLFAAALILVFRKQLWAWLKSVGRAILDFFGKDAAESAEPPDFVDLLEEAPPSPKKGTPALSDAQLLRRYRAQTDRLQKYRLGYRLLLRKMNRSNAGILPSDTAAAHLEKGRRVYGEALSPIMEGYNAVRYHEEEAGADPTAALDKILNADLRERAENH